MKSIGIIPARYGSTRFEGKPLALIKGKTMIEWVYKRAEKSNLDKVVVATDDKRIYNTVEAFGGEAVMTSENHNTGTDRIAEVAEKYGDYDIVLNVQGDEPLIEPEMINALLAPFTEEKNLVMATLKHKIIKEEEINNPNTVKVVSDECDYAIYFSRSPIPFPRKKEEAVYYRHVGIYGYSKEFLLKYAKMEQTPLERSESLEQLRALEKGYKIKVIETQFEVRGVDTKEDLLEVEKFITENRVEL